MRKSRWHVNFGPIYHSPRGGYSLGRGETAKSARIFEHLMSCWSVSCIENHRGGPGGVCHFKTESGGARGTRPTGRRHGRDARARRDGEDVLAERVSSAIEAIEATASYLEQAASRRDFGAMADTLGITISERCRQRSSGYSMQDSSERSDAEALNLAEVLVSGVFEYVGQRPEDAAVLQNRVLDQFRPPSASEQTNRIAAVRFLRAMDTRRVLARISPF
jgi:hypothetical protein